MKTIGAFEAKTHFSKLLRDVEQGDVYEIHRRGQAVARLSGLSAEHTAAEVQEVLGYFRRIREQHHASQAEITDWIQEGRR